MRLADYVFATVADWGVTHVFAVCGGAAMHLVDAAGLQRRLRYVAVQHEQAAAMAAEGYARITGRPGVVLVTSGPGGTNTLTGVCGAWIDSIPMVVISGQVTTDSLVRDTGLRQFGIQETDIVRLVGPVTKYAVTVENALEIKYHLQKAFHLATTGRPGPVWIDIPLDVQSRLVEPARLKGFLPPAARTQPAGLRRKAAAIAGALATARRPVIIAGYGIRSAAAQREFRRLVDRLGVPVVTSWTAADLIPTRHTLYAGRSGIFGERAANFAVQNADFLLILGSRLSVPQIGYHWRAFARSAKKAMVDIDAPELQKPSLTLNWAVCADIGEFLRELAPIAGRNGRLSVEPWRRQCRQWKRRYPVVLPEYARMPAGVNSFHFIDVLSRRLDRRAVVVTDMGTSFTCTMQAFQTRAGQRLFTSSGHASMGFGLPGAIGACCAAGRKVVCISGDGGLQMNVQELQTLVHYRLPVLLFVLNNGGYLTIKLMQKNHFGRLTGSDAGSGLSCPSILRIAKAYGIPAIRFRNAQQLRAGIDRVLAQPGPFLCEIMMPDMQPLVPRLASARRPDGSMAPRPLEDLYPFLDRREFLSNMLVPPWEPPN